MLVLKGHQETLAEEFGVAFIEADAAETFARAARGHWTVENQLHWCIDVAFREDESRVGEPVARENLAVLRHIAQRRLNNDPTKLGIETSV